jgi:hypothetical protein
MSSSSVSTPSPLLRPEAEAWLIANNLEEFIPFLRAAGFIDLASMATISERDAEAIGISQLGARRRLVLGLQRLLPAPQIGSPEQGPPSGFMIGSPDGQLQDHESGGDDTPKKKRGPMRCGKCHQWKKTCHGHCSTRCTSFATCPTQHRRAHPEVKEEEKELRRKDEDDRKRRREEDKEEKRREKKVHQEVEPGLGYPPPMCPGSIPMPSKAPFPGAHAAASPPHPVLPVDAPANASTPHATTSSLPEPRPKAHVAPATAATHTANGSGEKAAQAKEGSSEQQTHPTLVGHQV